MVGGSLLARQITAPGIPGAHHRHMRTSARPQVPWRLDRQGFTERWRSLAVLIALSMHRSRVRIPYAPPIEGPKCCRVACLLCTQEDRVEVPADPPFLGAWPSRNMSFCLAYRRYREGTWFSARQPRVRTPLLLPSPIRVWRNRHTPMVESRGHEGSNPSTRTITPLAPHGMGHRTVIPAQRCNGVRFPGAAPIWVWASGWSPALGAGRHRFESCHPVHEAVVQRQDRAPPSPRHGFKSRQPLQQASVVQLEGHDPPKVKTWVQIPSLAPVASKAHADEQPAFTRWAASSRLAGGTNPLRVQWWPLGS